YDILSATKTHLNAFDQASRPTLQTYDILSATRNHLRTFDAKQSQVPKLNLESKTVASKLPNPTSQKSQRERNFRSPKSSYRRNSLQSSEAKLHKAASKNFSREKSTNSIHAFEYKQVLKQWNKTSAGKQLEGMISKNNSDSFQKPQSVRLTNEQVKNTKQELAINKFKPSSTNLARLYTEKYLKPQAAKEVTRKVNQKQNLNESTDTLTKKASETFINSKAPEVAKASRLLQNQLQPELIQAAKVKALYKEVGGLSEKAAEAKTLKAFDEKIKNDQKTKLQLETSLKEQNKVLPRTYVLTNQKTIEELRSQLKQYRLTESSTSTKPDLKASQQAQLATKINQQAAQLPTEVKDLQKEIEEMQAVEQQRKEEDKHAKHGFDRDKQTNEIRVKATIATAKVIFERSSEVRGDELVGNLPFDHSTEETKSQIIRGSSLPDGVLPDFIREIQRLKYTSLSQVQQVAETAADKHTAVKHAANNNIPLSFVQRVLSGQAMQKVKA